MPFETSSKVLIGLSVVSILITAIVLLATSFQLLDPNEVALDYDHNIGLIAEKTKLYEGGRHFLGVNHEFKKFPRTVQSLVLDTQTVRSKDGLRIGMEVTVQYLFQPLNAATFLQIFELFELDYEIAFTDIIKTIIRDVSSNYAAFQFFEQRISLQADMVNQMRSFFQNISVSIEDMQIVNIDLPDAFSQEIQNTELAKQEATRALGEREVATLALQTREGQALGDIKILYLKRDTEVANILTQANITAQTIVAIYTSEAVALAAVKDSLNMTIDEFQAYMWIKTLEATKAVIYLSIDNAENVI